MTASAPNTAGPASVCTAALIAVAEEKLAGRLGNRDAADSAAFALFQVPGPPYVARAGGGDVVNRHRASLCVTPRRRDPSTAAKPGSGTPEFLLLDVCPWDKSLGVDDLGVTAVRRIAYSTSPPYLAPVAYTPDEQDLLIGEAMALGGRALVNDLADRASQLAAMVLDWDGTPPEPKHYRAARLLSFRQLLDDHKAGVDGPKPVPAPVVTSEDGKAALVHEKRELAQALRSALETLTDTELREYLDRVANHLQRQADEGL